jgi:hypothetical protein
MAKFTREDDGSVTIQLDAERAVVVSAEEWVDAVASVSPVGVTTATKAAAWRLHGL